MKTGAKKTGEGPRTSTDDQTENYDTVRGQLLWRATPNLTARLTADWTERDERCCVGVQLVTGDTAVYRPTDDEPFMNERQVAYFKTKLLSWKDDILRESKGTVTNLKAETENHPDLVDRASSESDRALELRTRDRGTVLRADARAARP